MKLETHAPVTVLYRADLRDTAVVVGLVQAHVPIGVIAYTGDIDKVKMEYIGVVNKWLQSKRQPTILVHPDLTLSQLERILVDPLSKWGWGKAECNTVLRLHGIPVPK